MGVSCCSHAKEPSEITILKPEKNIISSNNVQTNQNNIINNVNNNPQIVDLEQKSRNQNQNITNNTLNQPNDLNSYQNSSSSPLTKKEIDELLNQAFQNNNNYQDINNTNPNNNINNVTPQYENVDLNKYFQNQNQNEQNVPLEQELEKYITSQPDNKNQINQENDADLNIEEILKKQSNQTNTDFDIEEIIKNTESNINKQSKNNVDDNINNLNLDVFFNQTGNAKIDDELINKLFESAEKRSDNNPLYLSQQMQSTQLKNNLQSNLNVNNKYYSPVNTTQRSEVFPPVSSKFKQIYEVK